MKRAKLGVIIFCIGMFSSELSFANGWYDWVKQSLSEFSGRMKVAYETFSIPRPHLLKKDTFSYTYNQIKKTIHTFFYDISHDNDELRKLRNKSVCSSGFYFDVNDDFRLWTGDLLHDEHNFVSKELKNRYENDPLYKKMKKKDEYGHFHDIRWCMQYFLAHEFIFVPLRRLDIRTHREIAQPKKEKEALIQLLWELESALPDDFDKDETGEKFIRLIKASSEQDYFNRFSYAHARAVAWKTYSRRFFRNKGLDKAINYFAKKKKAQ